MGLGKANKLNPHHFIQLNLREGEKNGEIGIMFSLHNPVIKKDVRMACQTQQGVCAILFTFNKEKAKHVHHLPYLRWFICFMANEFQEKINAFSCLSVPQICLCVCEDTAKKRMDRCVLNLALGVMDTECMCKYVWLNHTEVTWGTLQSWG